MLGVMATEQDKQVSGGETRTHGWLAVTSKACKGNTAGKVDSQRPGSAAILALLLSMLLQAGPLACPCICVVPGAATPAQPRYSHREVPTTDALEQRRK